MNNKNFETIYLNQVKVDLSCCGVSSQKADVCIVPQFKTGVALTGTSAELIHSASKNGVVAFQNYIIDKKLEAKNAFCASCKGNYQYLIHIPILAKASEQSNSQSFHDIYDGVVAAIEEAHSVNAKKILIPSIGDEKCVRLSHIEVAKAVYRAIQTAARHDDKIIIAVKNQETMRSYKKALALKSMQRHEKSLP